MTSLSRAIGLAIGFWALGAAIPAGAQENLDLGKSGAQLYASDCAICHKSPQSLGKAGGIFGLQSFLREHYTASRESAAAIADYLQGVQKANAPSHERAVKRGAKGDERRKAGGNEKKPEPGKAGTEKSHDDKPAAAKATEPKSSEPSEKPSGDKPAAAKSTDKPGEAKAAPPKPEKPKTSTPTSDKAKSDKAKSDEPKPEPKSDEPKSDKDKSDKAKSGELKPSKSNPNEGAKPVRAG